MASHDNDAGDNDNEDQNGVDTLQRLNFIWKRASKKGQRRNFLKAEVKNWIKPEHLEDFETIWEEKIVKVSIKN